MKKYNWKNYHTNLSFTDLLFNLLLGFICLFVLSYLLINLETKKANIETKAEIVITLIWDSESLDDVDMWICDPEKNVMFFRNMHVGLIHLDRDDLGMQNDTMVTEDGRTIIYPYNQEIGTIRGFLPGEWIINVHMYNKRDVNPSKVTVKMEKLNPLVKVIIFKEFIMSKQGEEVTIARIMMSANGDILSVNDTPAKLVEQFLIHEGRNY